MATLSRKDFINWGAGQLKKIDTVKDFRARVAEFGRVTILGPEGQEMTLGNGLSEVQQQSLDKLKVDYLATIDAYITSLENEIKSHTIQAS